MKKWWFVCSIVLIGMMLLSACATPATTAPAQTAATNPPAAQEMVTIRWRTRPDNQAEQDVYQKISDDLSAQLAAKGIKLQYDPAPVSGYEDKLKAEFSAGNAPDVVWIPGASTADYAQLGVILDLKPLADKDAGFKIGDYYDAPMKELQNGGHLWGLPRDISTLVMYYNKDLFAKYNVDDPAKLASEGKWNWESFERVAKELTHPADKIYGFSLGNWWGLWGYFVNAGGGSLFNADRTACGLTDPGSIKGLQFMQDLFVKDKVAPPPTNVDSVGETEWHSGSIGMYPNGRWMTPSDRQNDKFKWAVVEMPEGAKKSTWLFWGPYVISAKAKNPDKAWEVVKALTSPEVQAKVAALGTNIPSNKAQTAVDAFLNSKPPDDNQPFIAGAAYAQAEIPLFTGNWGDIVNGQYQPNIDKIFAGKATVEEAVKAACDGSNPLFKK
ncbi:MAG: sugar ABC transporter substrate-binding protein [Anaerolineaceae bacterium]|nr:sugar ABC transporter substrate-binding protein [Anaerolineaceae bacterium]